MKTINYQKLGNTLKVEQRQYDQRKTNINQLLSFNRLNDTKAMAKLVAKMGKQLNQRLYRIEKADRVKESFAYQRAYREQGGKPRYSQYASKLEKMSLDALYKQGLSIANKLGMQTSSVAGIKELYKYNMRKAVDRLNDLGINVSEKQLRTFLEAKGGDYLHASQLSSTQLIKDMVDYTKSGIISVEEFVEQLQQFSDAETVNYDQLIQNLNNLVRDRIDGTDEQVQQMLSINSGSKQ